MAVRKLSLSYHSNCSIYIHFCLKLISNHHNIDVNLHRLLDCISYISEIAISYSQISINNSHK